MLAVLLRAVVICLPVCLVAASCGDQEPAEEVDCAPTVEYEGTALTQGVFALAGDLPPPAGTVETKHACARTKWTLERRRGVPPSVALFPPGPEQRDRSRVEMFVADDALVSVRGHPLHRAVYGSDDKPDLRSGRACTPISFDAEVVSVDFGQLLLDRDGRDIVVHGDARTLVDGPLVDGVPRIPKDASVRVEAVRCKGAPRLVARRLKVTER